MEQFFSQKNSRFEERFTQLSDISHNPNCIYNRENFTKTKLKYIKISDIFPMDCINNFSNLISLVEKKKGLISNEELYFFITDIENKLVKLKEASGIYNNSPK
jgi:hypothetical protein